MSVKVMGLVWDLAIEPNKKFVLLAYADHADHRGKNIFPAIETIINKTGYHERSVQRITRELEEEGYLISDGCGPKGTNKWAIPLSKGGDKIAPLANCRGDIPSGGILTPESIKPSVKEDEEEIARRTKILTTLYEQNIGAITPLLADIIRNATIDYPQESWYQPAFEIAIKNNVRKWEYIDAILDGWKRNYFGWKPERKNGNGRKNGKTPATKPDLDDGFMEELARKQGKAA